MNQSTLQRRFQGLTDVEGAKQIAKRIFNQYSKDQTEITELQCVPMISETYKQSDSQFLPKDSDIKGYFSVLDGNKDGRITYSDIEALCVRYLCAGLITNQVQYQPQVQIRQIQSIQTQQIELPKRQAPRRFSADVESKLDVARRLFAQFDKDGSGQLEEAEVYNLLKQTYVNMGMNNVVLSQDDIKSWIEMNDSDGDGKVSLAEYETVVLRSLQRAGFVIDTASQHIQFK